MPRAFLIVLDSVGCGGAPDAADFGDEGANTLAHIALECAAGRADVGRSGNLHLPTLDNLGLGAAINLASGIQTPGLTSKPAGLWGAATEVSIGKDTPSGHWELSGLPVPWDWHYFPDAVPAFPDALVMKIQNLSGTNGILGNCHASGTDIIAQLGKEHIQTGWPICYTSADSVLQIAAHEETFGLNRLLELCQALAPELHSMKVGRVIARPFVGDLQVGFTRTSNRRDFAMLPPQPTLCDWVQATGRNVNAVGKIGDIFSMRGIDRVVKGPDNVLFDGLCDFAEHAVDGSLTFANFVEFDTLYGHRRDVAGYARHLEWFDAQLPRFLKALGPDDLAIFTADHGNDPTWSGTDHTRERVPVLGYGAGCKPVGHVAFSDVGASVASHLGVTSQGPGRSFL